MISATPEIRIYDRDMNFQGIIDAASSLQWHRRYYSPGEVELHCPITENSLLLLKRENLVYLKGAVEAAVIEDLEIHDAATKTEIIAKGRFLSCYMDRRLIRPFFHTENGNAETAMRNILSGAAEIPRVELADAHGFTKSITFQATYKNLLVYEEKLAKYLQAGFRFRPDFSAKKIYFEVYEGEDHTTTQKNRPWVLFSDQYGNLEEFDYVQNDTLYTNVCYVGGLGTGTSRTYVVSGDDTLTGLDRRETFVSASDVTTDNLTTVQYQAALKQRGVDHLEPVALSIDTLVNPVGNFGYKTDYDLGDLVTIRKERYGIEIDERIVEVTEVYENGSLKVSLTFGTPIPETIDWTDSDI